MAQLNDLSLWDEDYVLSLPNEEFDWIDYKASEKFTNSGWRVEMSKYVSAWANYDGGYIIFGVKDPSAGSPLEIDGGISKSVRPDLSNWLDQVIPSLVDPPLRRIITKVIAPKTEHSSINPGHVLIAVQIPESDVAPHQALDHKYYQRLGRRLEPLRHRAILDIFSRRHHPEIRSTIIVHIGNAKPILFWKIKNVGRVMAKEWKVVIRFPTKVESTLVKLEDNKVTICETDDNKSYWEVRQTRHLGSPLFPDSDVSGTFELKPISQFDPPLGPSIDYVEVTCYADDAPAFIESFQIDAILRRH
jgi:hypothetical protein